MFGKRLETITFQAFSCGAAVGISFSRKTYSVSGLSSVELHRNSTKARCSFTHTAVCSRFNLLLLLLFFSFILFSFIIWAVVRVETKHLIYRFVQEKSHKELFFSKVPSG